MSEALKLARVRTAEAFAARLGELGITLPFDATPEPTRFAETLQAGGRTVGNRFCVLPMEGWDASEDGRPTDLVKRRWQRFGASGAKLVWGGEAYAVVPEGRANPHQLCRNAESEADLEALRETLVAAHEAACGDLDGLFVGLQLTHSGRFSRPHGAPAPRTAFRDPVLDRRVGVDSDDALLSDAELDDLVVAYGRTARHARNAGFDFVDVKACHGYLGHELLSAYERTGRYGGDLDGRMHFLLGAIEAVRNEAPELAIGVRLSIFDLGPYRAGEDGVGLAEERTRRYLGESDGNVDLEETHRIVSRLEAAGVSMLCTTAGSPYTNPHSQRPAFYPPSDGYAPPEDPLVGVARQIHATAEIKRKAPRMCVVGSAYTYLQEWLPHVASAVLREHGADSIGLGRMMLSYPELPLDVIAARALKKPLVCRTFSDCTTAPRNGLVSGCYPIDPFYKKRPEAKTLATIKRETKR